MDTTRLIQQVYSDNIEMACRALQELGLVAPTDLLARSFLREIALKAEKSRLRKTAAESLARLNLQEAVATFLAASRSLDPGQRVRGIEGLGVIGAVELINEVYTALNSADQQIVRAAVVALGRIGRDLRAADILEQFTQKPYLPQDLLDNARRSLTYILVRLAYEEKKDLNQHKQAVRRLAMLAPAFAREKFQGSALNNDPEKRAVAYINLGILGDVNGLDTVIKGLADPDCRARRMAAIATGKLDRTGTAIAALTRATSGPPEVRQADIQAIEIIRNRINASRNENFLNSRKFQREGSYEPLAF